MGWSRDEIISATAGEVLQEGKQRVFGEIVTDSARVTTGAIFVALKGERLDGHRFARAAIRAGAACVVIHKPVRQLGSRKVTVVRVPDTLRALGDLAHYRRIQYGPKVLAITGSNGKTTTKEMLAAILEQASWQGRPLRGRVLKTEGNFNNLVGLPLTLLRLRRADRVAVVELGTNHPGEIERLAAIADPDMGMITSVAAAHLEGLNSLAGVAREKGALFGAVRPGGKIAVNLDDPWVARLSKKFAGAKVTYGRRGWLRAESDASLGPKGTRFTLRVGRQRCRIRVNFVGRHNISNALGAAAMAHGFGASLAAIRRGLEQVRPFPMRMQIQDWCGVGIINDAYNANPASMEAALRALSDIPGRGEKIAVLGDMLELGRQSRARHFELGKQAARLKIDRLYILGRYAPYVRRGALRAGMAWSIVGRDHGEIARLLRRHVQSGDWLLFKGSRAMKMESVLQHLTSGQS